MKNQEQLSEEEITNIGQFKVGRNPAEDQDQENHNDGHASTASGYTPGETEFADGEGTRLEEETEAPDTDEQEDDDPEEQETDPAQEEDDAEFENPDDDPA